MPTGAGGGGGGGTNSYLIYGTRSAYGALPQANAVSISGFFVEGSLLFSNVVVSCSAGDASNNYDFGIYNPAGTLLANAGAVHMTASSFNVFAVLQGATKLNAGRYVFAWTGNASTATIANDSGNIGSWVMNTNYATSSGGVLPASVTAFTISTNINCTYFHLY